MGHLNKFTKFVMNIKRKNMNLEAIREYLVDHDIRPLKKRIKNMEYLIRKRNHPTVDMIYSDLIREIPSLSKTTVYNVLKLFVQKGVAISLTIEGNEVRFDADVRLHGHFKCNVCGGVFDFSVGNSKEIFPGLDGFIIEESHVYLKGICSFCQSKHLYH